MDAHEQPMDAESSSDAIIQEFERRCREFRRPWERNFAFVAMPGFLIFMVAVVTDTKAAALVGFAVILVAAARGARIMLKYQRCPACESIQGPAIQFPYRVCRACGAQLSRGVIVR